ncbi:MAG: bis(5'-nucleosyl)-tetraphosphatase (symmetrical) YqeK [Lachnospiraceae bacterium]|nr:bis(5'-nucleosyl)-tetraphosphatase (symmetrical) YqeK [Lachnospiraceae bacterium]
MNYDVSEIKKKLKKDLDKARYKHTKGVANTAVSLAMRYEYDLDKAYVAGLLHDCAKCFELSEMEELCEKYGYELSEAEKKNPALIHAGLGVYVAMDRYDIKDNDILSAIKWHTTGHADMTVLEKIIFVADYIEPGRYKQDNLQLIRKTAFTDIDECIFMISRDTLNYLEKSDTAFIDPYTRQAYDYYLTIHNQKEGM